SVPMNLCSQVARQSRHHSKHQHRLLHRSLWHPSLVQRRRDLSQHSRHHQHLHHQIRRSQNLCRPRLSRHAHPAIAAGVQQ
ncbi:MAG TPA: hypothetical protein VHK27_03820, partial [Gammaproteobacteria bacterium]|nr:hypothetical protein [Gammaproteobacteria bacterium]